MPTRPPDAELDEDRVDDADFVPPEQWDRVRETLLRLPHLGIDTTGDDVTP